MPVIETTAWQLVSCRRARGCPSSLCMQASVRWSLACQQPAECSGTDKLMACLAWLPSSWERADTVSLCLNGVCQNSGARTASTLVQAASSSRPQSSLPALDCSNRQLGLALITSRRVRLVHDDGILPLVADLAVVVCKLPACGCGRSRLLDGRSRALGLASG